jgi:hypothetical protein
MSHDLGIAPVLLLTARNDPQRLARIAAWLLVIE